MRIEPVEPVFTTFAGEGKTHRFAQGVDAISGVAAHAAANVAALSAQAARAGQVVVDEAVEVQFAPDPETGRRVVVGGRSRVTFRPERAPGPPLSPEDESAPAVHAPAATDDRAGEPMAVPPGADPAQVLDQAAAAVDQRIAAVEQRLAGASAAERPLLEGELRALRQRRDELERARHAVERQETLRRAGRPTGGDAAPAGEAPAPAVPRPTGRRPAGPARGVFIPAMTQSGLLVNTSA
ncbi:MAG: hypothetical protein HYU88_10920 [Chloroflexi bacterium]|nr:hypothetical protein [Chloroflexota bacterium]